MQVESFPPVANETSRVVILGSMPGQASLAAGEYYAHPRNAFWPIMGALLGFSPDEPYAVRLGHLLAGRVALWDVLQSCRRATSLDADIDDATSVPNRFAEFFLAHQQIRTIFFNGAKAESAFTKLVVPTLPAELPLTRQRLPSTSPANASWRYEQKLAAWRQMIQGRDSIAEG